VADVREALLEHFETHRERVFYTRQLEILFEDQFFHWITARGIRELVESGLVVFQKRQLGGGTEIHLSWHKHYRYYKRAANKVVELVQQFSHPNVTAYLGLQGEMLVLEAFARNQFLLRGRDAKEFEGRQWTESDHDIDFVFERDGVPYGIEVKNMLGYMDQKEFDLKIRLCRKLGVRPVFAARMLPKSWIHELNQQGGYAMIMKYQLYPWTHMDLVKRVRAELGLPVDAPRALLQGTRDRFIAWHGRKV
jgi:hypothetical protein